MKQLRDYQKKAVNECWEALKQDDEPVLLMASVGAGKSLMLADILMRLQKNDKLALCLVNNAQLVASNCKTFIEQGGKASIYCAALNSKDASENVIFGTPKSVLNAILNNEKISTIPFNIIIVDEAHAIDYTNHRTTFMRILRHYKHQYPDMRVLGATGTNFRFRGTEIVGEDCLFQSQVGNITTESLIESGYLIKPEFKVDKNLVLDFSRVKVRSNGKFDPKQLEDVISKSARLTEKICHQIMHIVKEQNRFGVFIFATTKKHAHEIMGHLPPNESALILGETPEHERTQILERARCGDIRYLVNISIISVGIDIPPFDTVAYLRPTESLVLLVQTLGRGLRLSEQTGKTDALVLDYAGNIERHQDWDNPILMDAMKQIDEDYEVEFDVQCPRCMEMNKFTARRCRGVDVISKERCDYFFEFKECEYCKTENDISARQCRMCDKVLIDPDRKLKLEIPVEELKAMDVIEAKYGVSDTQTNHFRINCMYRCKDEHGKVAAYYENYTPSSDKAKHVFYGQFIKKHCETPSEWYNHITERGKMVEMLEKVRTPVKIMLKFDETGYRIKRKIFNHEETL